LPSAFGSVARSRWGIGISTRWWCASPGSISICGARSTAKARSWTSSSSATLIVENAKQTGRSVGALQAMTDQQLVGVTLEWFDWPKERFGALSGDDQRAIIEQICAFLDHRDTWMDTGERLAWVAGLVSSLAKSVPDDADAEQLARKQLAVNLLRSVWLPLESVGRGLDYFGKGPSFAPGLSFNSCDKALDDSLAFLGSIETAKTDYFGKLQKQQDAANDLATARKTYKEKRLLSGFGVVGRRVRIEALGG
jgi:hypothetical protein